jgi:hypothetical protein
MKLIRFETPENATAYVRKCLTDQEMPLCEIRAFIAGAAMLGVLQPSACAWWRDYLVNRHFVTDPPRASEILAQGEKSQSQKQSVAMTTREIDFSKPKTLLDP